MEEGDSWWCKRSQVRGKEGGSCKLKRVGGPSELGRSRVGGFIGVMKITGNQGYSQGVWRQWKTVEGQRNGAGGMLGRVGGFPWTAVGVWVKHREISEWRGTGGLGEGIPVSSSSVELMEEIFLNGGGESDSYDEFA